jgi:uncharacterized protein YndB with AHSA1/START domain
MKSSRSVLKIDYSLIFASPTTIAGLFLDTSKNHSCRWCNMGDCCIRAKQRWHYRRTRKEYSTQGTILEVIENKRLAFTFGDKEPDSEEKIRVTVDVSLTDEKTTLLRLVQENMADTPQARVSWHMQCNLGWSFFMTNLKGWLEYGVDLRETDRERAYDARALTH